VGRLIAEVLPLALGAAVSPAVLTVQLLVLSGPKSAIARAWAVVLGAATTLLVYSVLGTTILRNVGEHHAGNPSPASGWIKLLAAVLLLALAARTLSKRPTAADAHPHRIAVKLTDAGLTFFVGIGIVAMLTNFTTLVLYLPALHEIAHSTVSVAGRVAVFAMLFLITLIPAYTPPLSASLMGSRSAPVLARLNRFTTLHQRQINAGICLVFAAFLGWQGVHSI